MRMNSIFYHDYNHFFLLFFLFQFCDFKSLVNLSPKKLQFLQFIYFFIFTFVTKFVKLSTRCKNLPPLQKKMLIIIIAMKQYWWLNFFQNAIIRGDHAFLLMVCELNPPPLARWFKVHDTIVLLVWCFTFTH